MREKALSRRQRGVHHDAADILEVAVDAVGASRLEILVQLAGLVVDAGIEPQLLDDEVALGLAAGDAHGAAALQLGELSDHAADRAGGRGHHHGLAGERLAVLQQTDPGGRARHADAAQVA